MENQQHFKFIELNKVRLFRHVEAAKVEVSEEGYWLWMSEKEIKLNIESFGDHPELQKALDAYGANRD